MTGSSADTKRTGSREAAARTQREVAWDIMGAVSIDGPQCFRCLLHILIFLFAENDQFLIYADAFPQISPHAVHVRYLPGYVEGGPWQMAVINCGNEVVPAGYEEYPYREDEAMHPSGYFYTWKNGRVLNDYPILIATEGKGSIRPVSAGRLRDPEGRRDHPLSRGMAPLPAG